MADALGNVTTTQYQESAGGLSKSATTTSPDPDGLGPLSGFTTTVNLNPLTGQTLASVDANGLVTTRTYDSLRRLLTVRLPQHESLTLPSIAYEYRVDPNGLNSVVTKTLSADGTSQLVSVVLYDGLLRAFQTQSAGLDAGADHNDTAEERGRMVSHTYYDSAGRVSQSTGQWWAQGAPSATPIVPVAVPPSLTTYVYDDAGRAVAEVFWIGTSSEPANERWRTTTAYDGDSTLVVPPIGATPEATVVDARGRVVERIQYVRDPDDNSAADTPAEVLALPHQSTTYAYDSSGRLSRLNDAENNSWTYGYDWAGRQTTAEDPDGGVTTKTYDLLDRVVTQTNANSQVLAYTYDALGRADTVRDGSVAGTVRTRWTYDTALDVGGKRVLGQLATSTRYVAGQAYMTKVDRYDSAYRPLATTFTLPNTSDYQALSTRSYTSKYTYTAGGQVSTTALPAIVAASGVKALGAETVTTRYNSASMPTWMSGGFGWGTYVAESRFAADGRATATDLGNTYGAYVTYGYEDGTNRLTGITLTRQNLGVGLNLRYGFDAAGNVTSLKDQPTASPGTQDNQCFGYDGLRRLEVAWTALNGDCATAQDDIVTADVGGAQPYWTEYEYDTLGNRTSMVEHGVAGKATTSSAYSVGVGAASPHQIVSLTKTTLGTSSTTSFEYDDAGNRTQRTSGSATDSYVWDAEGELASDDDYTYVYDASGNRIVRDGDDGTTVYLPGGQEVTIDGSAVSAARYYSFAGRTIATRTSNGLGGVTSLVADRDGSVVAAVPNTEWTTASLSRVHSDPFGAVRGNSDAGVPGDHRFLGATRDADSGLTLLGARYYDAVVGCFISVDPVLNLDVPAHLHAYAYGFNNPVSFADPSGMEPKDKNGNYDGDYGGGGGASAPSTSWAAAAACSDASCTLDWMWSFTANYYGGIGEILWGTLLGTCTMCQAFASLGGSLQFFTDPAAFQAQKEAEGQQFQDFWSDPWNNFWRPIGEDWANNPGHAFGSTLTQAGLLALPGGAVLKAGRVTEAAASGSARFTVGSDGVATDLIGNTNAISLGHYPAYVESASATGARTFSVSDEAWEGMTATEQWIRNQAFLDTAIRMGSEIQLATPLDLMRQGTYFEREVSYLTSKGFVPDNSGRTMIQGGKK